MTNGPKCSRTVFGRQKMLVCLISPNYLGSTWCGRELEIFLQRLASQNPAAPKPYIFPVWWELLPGRSLPPKLSAYQNNEDAFHPRYREKGLRQLATLPKFRGAFLEFVRNLDGSNSRRYDHGFVEIACVCESCHRFFRYIQRADDPIRELRPRSTGFACLRRRTWKPAGNLPSLAETVSGLR